MSKGEFFNFRKGNSVDFIVEVVCIVFVKGYICVVVLNVWGIDDVEIFVIDDCIVIYVDGVDVVVICVG